MGEASPKPIILSQNRLRELLDSREERVALYAEVLERRIAETARGDTKLRVPASRGLRRRLAGKPFHGDPEFFFQEGGALAFELPEEAFTLRAGEAGLIPTGLPHGERWSGRFFNVIFMVQPDGFSLHVGYLDGGPKCGPADRFIGPTETLVRYAEELAASAGGAPTGEGLRQGLMLAFMCRLRESLDRDTPAPAVGAPLLRRCQELMDTHYARLDFSVEWLAANLGCSPDHLSRVFRRRTGRRLIESMHDLRIERACRLLRGSPMGVAEVAWPAVMRAPRISTGRFGRGRGRRRGSSR
jgi:AraC-like DNA-binding protein